MRWAWMLLFLGACGEGGTVEATATDTSTTTTTGLDCTTDIPTLPIEVSERIGGFTGAEDFGLDNSGRYVAADEFGNIVRRDIDGNGGIWTPGFAETAGTHFMPDGHLAIADVFQGRVVRIQKNGSQETMIGGMTYPNGVTVDMDGIVYVADQTTGEVIRYDPELDQRQVIASELFNPNGLALSVDHKTLYVGSFGGGTVHEIDLDADDGAVLFGQTPGGTIGNVYENTCDGLSEGDECFLDYIGVGSCVSSYGDLSCQLTVNTTACENQNDGDPCQQTVLGQQMDSVCTIQPTLEILFCPRVPAEVVTSCLGEEEDAPCTALGIDRECRPSWEEIMICDVTAWGEQADAACDGLANDDECVIIEYEGYVDGTCQPAQMGPGLTCDPGWGGGGQQFSGGLDGIAVDTCGYVWVTEYTLGYVWRFGPEGGEPELAVETETFWIPNMHWGNGIGGWDADTMYMQDRSTDELLVIPIGIPGAPEALVPVDETEE